MVPRANQGLQMWHKTGTLQEVEMKRASGCNESEEGERETRVQLEKSSMTP